MIIRRSPWRLELFRLTKGELLSVGFAAVDDGNALTTESVPFRWRIVTGSERPRIEMACTEDDRCWQI